MQPGLAVIHGNHLEHLTALTVQWLRDNPLSPLENEVFLVQSNGMAQWLKLQLAADDACGISAAQHFQMPARFLWSAYRNVLGEAAVPASSPFDKAPLLWRLMQLLPSLLERDSFQPLRRFLADDDDLRKRYQLAERLADLFDQYQVYRADWLALWQQGNAALTSPLGKQSPLDENQRWQAELWQALIDSLPATQQASSRAHIHQAFMHALQQGAVPQGLPRRLVVFGITSLPRQILDALHALSPHCQILMLVQNPCQHYWADIIEDRQLLRLQQQRHPRRPDSAPVTDSTQLQHGHPLLAAWGKQGRDYIGLLYDYDVPARYRDWFNQIDLFYPVAEVHQAPDSLLAQLQQSILDLQPLPAQPQCVTADASIRFHCAHSPQREVEILHDQLLAAFADNATDTSNATDSSSAAAGTPLQPRDIIVMVPDIDTYAPHIDAVFGTADGSRQIPYTLSDRQQRHQQPLAIALEALLSMPQARFTVSDLLDLLEVAPLRARFAIAESDLPLLRRWLEESGIRWGLHEEQRQSLDLPPGFQQNSWVFGLERMLLGYASGTSDEANQSRWQDIEPYSEVSGLAATLAGQLYDLLSTLQRHWQRLRQPATVDDWVSRLHALLDELFLLQTEPDLQLQETLHDALMEWQSACQQAQLEELLPLSVVREAWLGALDQGGLSQRFLAGRVTFCTLMPMRSIPFRYVCLLGMNDGDYPRSQMPLDFDLMAQRGQYRPGDRSRRDDDRYLFLEALLAARQTLYISWLARDVRDNQLRPPSVLVAQLRDYLASAFCLAHGDLLEALTVQHPLQPFSKQYFDGSHPALFSYDAEWRAAHDTAIPEADQPLPLPAADAPITLNAAQLARFLKDPPKLFFNERLKVRFNQDENRSDDDEPFAIDGLSRYQIVSTLLTNVMQALPDQQKDAFAATQQQLLGSGMLPVGLRGAQLLNEIIGAVEPAIKTWQDYCARYPDRQPTRELYWSGQIGEHRFILEDWLNDLRRHGEKELLRINVVAGALNKKAHRLLNDWCLHLLGNACHGNIHTVVIGEDQIITFAPLPQQTAAPLLDQCLRAWLCGLTAPLPLACRSGIALIEAERNERTRKDPLLISQKVFEGSGQHGGELHYADQQALRRAYADFAALTAPQHNGETAFSYWARQLYQPLLEHAGINTHGEASKHAEVSRHE